MATSGNEIASTGSKGDVQALRRAYYDRLSQKDMAPLWEVLRDLVPAEPVTPYIPAIWRFDDFRSAAQLPSPTHMKIDVDGPEERVPRHRPPGQGPPARPRRPRVVVTSRSCGGSIAVRVR